MATSKCAQCNEIVYPLERAVFAEKVFHKGCAKCSHCQGTLTISSFASANGKLFCKPHYLELFRSSGGKYAFAGQDGQSSTSSMPAERGEVINESVRKSIGGARQQRSSIAPSNNNQDTPSKNSNNKLAAFLSGTTTQCTTPSTPVKSTPVKKSPAKTGGAQSVNQAKAEIETMAQSENSKIGTNRKTEVQSKPANKLAAFLAQSYSNNSSEPKDEAVVEEVVEKVPENAEDKILVGASTSVAMAKDKEKNENAKPVNKLAAFLSGGSVEQPTFEKTTTTIVPDVLPTPSSEPAVKESSNIATQEPIISKNKEPQQEKPVNKLTAFLAGQGASNQVVAPEPEQPSPEPIRMEQPAIKAPEESKEKEMEEKRQVVAQPHQPGLSKLALFLQQVETSPTAYVEEQKEAEVPKDTVIPKEEPKVSVSELVKQAKSHPSPKNTRRSHNGRVIKSPKKVSIVEVPLEEDTENQSSLSNIVKENNHQQQSSKKSTLAEIPKIDIKEIELLRSELAKYKGRCEELESEMSTLKGRLEQSEAEKNVLAKEVDRLNAALNASIVNTPSISTRDLLETNGSRIIENSLRHARKLLSQGKITQAQYEAAARACIEASRAVASM